MAVALRIVALAQLTVCVASIVVASLTMYYASPDITWPISSGVGFWGIIQTAVAGSLAIAATVKSRPACCSARGLNYGHFINSLLCMCVTTAQFFAYTIPPLIECSEIPLGEAYCEPNGAEIRILSICSIVIASLIFILALTGMIVFRKTIGAPGRTCDNDDKTNEGSEMKAQGE